MNFAFLEKRKFILMIGDDGAILVFLNGTKVEKRLFAASSSLNDRREFNTLFNKYPMVPISILLDTMEQSYTKQTLPAVSSFAIGKLVKKRLDRDFSASDIKGAILLGKDTEGRKDWIYMFASAPVTSFISEWVDYVSSLENSFTGIYMLPVEMESFVTNFNKKFLQNKEQATDWQFLITYNKTGGFRQVVLQNGKVIFTRLIRPGKDNVPDIIAGNIEQEILNTIDYMRRLSFNDDDAITIIAVLSKEIKKSLTDTKINGKDIHIFTPFEAAEMLGMHSVTEEDDKFSDLVIAANFAKSKSILKLESPKIKAINSFIMVGNIATVIAFLIIPVFIIYSGYLGYKIISMNGSIKLLENEKASIEQKWKNAKASGDYNIDDANKIIDVVTLHKKLSDTVSPLDLIIKASVPQVDVALTNSLTWSYKKDVTSSPSSSRSKSNSNSSQDGKEDAVFNLDFTNTGDSIEKLLENFEQFRSSIKSNLSEYELGITELPDTINFDDKRNNIPVKIEIRTPSKDKKS